MALMADLVMEIIFARDIGGLESISENNYRQAVTAKGQINHVEMTNLHRTIKDYSIWLLNSLSISAVQ